MVILIVWVPSGFDLLCTALGCVGVMVCVFVLVACCWLLFGFGLRLCGRVWFVFRFVVCSLLLLCGLYGLLGCLTCLC